jgi:hypothetical protein
MKEKKSIKCYSLDAFDGEGKLIGMSPENFQRLTTLAERVQDFRLAEGKTGKKVILVRVDLTEKEAGQRQTEIIFGSVKAC